MPLIDYYGVYHVTKKCWWFGKTILVGGKIFTPELGKESSSASTSGPSIPLSLYSLLLSCNTILIFLQKNHHFLEILKC